MNCSAAHCATEDINNSTPLASMNSVAGVDALPALLYSVVVVPTGLQILPLDLLTLLLFCSRFSLASLAYRYA